MAVIRDYRSSNCCCRRSAYYWLIEPVFLVSVFLYVILRFLIRPHIPFDYWTDLFLVPGMLPPMLTLYETLGWRKLTPLTLKEVLVHLVIWSVVIEGVGPLLYSSSTADINDVLAYVVGGLLYYLLRKKWDSLQKGH